MCLFQQIKWTNLLVENADSICKVSVDGTDFSIYEPKPFDTKCFCRRFKGSEPRYDVALCTSTEYKVCAHGPFPCDSWPDQRAFLNPCACGCVHASLRPQWSPPTSINSDRLLYNRLKIADRRLAHCSIPHIALPIGPFFHLQTSK